MNSTAPTLPGLAPQHDFERVAELQLISVMSNGRAFAPAYVAIALAIAVLIQPAMSRLVLLAWLATYLLYIGARSVSTLRYHRDPTRAQPDRVRAWSQTVTLSAAAHGLILGAPALLALPHLSASRQAMLTFVAVLICAAAAIYVAALIRALFVLVVSTILPYIVSWFFLARIPELPIAQSLLIAMLMNLYLCWNNYKVFLRTAQLVVLNENLNRQLLAKNRLLEEAGKSRTQLFAVASHDLRQPVHAMGLTVAQLNEHDHPATLRRHFDKLQQASFMVSEMLLELMDLRNLERNEYALKLGPVSLDAVLEQLRMTQENVATGKGLQLDVNANSGLWVVSDVNLLRRILLNLLSNAIKYTFYGTVSISCEARDSRVYIRVRDTGIGMPADRLKDIFDDNVRLHGVGQAADGIGLGLAIVHRAATLLQHELRVTSELGRGSVFELQAEAAHPTAGTEILPPVAALGGDDEVVVVIEDDSHALEALTGLLTQWGYQALGGTSAQEAIEALKGHAAPALVISDFQLGSYENGLDAIAKVRARCNDAALPALLLTGDVQHGNGTRMEGRQITVAHKPFAPVFLRQEIDRLLKQRAVR